MNNKDFKHLRIGVGIIVHHQGRVLFGKRKSALGYGLWSTAGGHLEEGESIESCARRELQEETGLNALSMKRGPALRNCIEGQDYLTHFVFVDAFEGQPALMEPSKCEGWHWFFWEEAPSPLFPTIQSLIDHVGIENLKTQAKVIL